MKQACFSPEARNTFVWRFWSTYPNQLFNETWEGNNEKSSITVYWDFTWDDPDF